MTNSETAAQLVQRVAQQRGLPSVDPEAVEFILWEHTGFPSFFDGDPAEVLERQINEFFEGVDDDE